MHKPNFFIVGAPKCGTTALASYLGEHPDIFISEVKEPHYFSDDLPDHRYVKTLEDYLKLFENGKGKKIVGEGSVHYLFSEVAIANIREFNPSAKLVAMLRNPVEMVHSLHGQFLHSLNEDETNFERAWELQEQRAKGMSLPPDGNDPALLQYKRVGSYSDQVARMLQHFPRDQVKIVLYDDFRRNPRGVYEEVLDFLGVQSDGRREFPVINSSHAYRFRPLGVLLGRKPAMIRKAWAFVKRTLGLDERSGQAIGDWLQNKNKVFKPHPPLSSGMRSTLTREFAGDVSRLETMIGRDLSGWR